MICGRVKPRLAEVVALLRVEHGAVLLAGAVYAKRVECVYTLVATCLICALMGRAPVRVTAGSVPAEVVVSAAAAPVAQVQGGPLRPVAAADPAGVQGACSRVAGAPLALLHDTAVNCAKLAVLQVRPEAALDGAAAELAAAQLHPRAPVAV